MVSMVFNEEEGALVAGRILEGARRHFFAHGFRGVTMGALATELGMSKKTLYAHYPSKKALLEAVVADKLADVEADLASVVDRGEPDLAGRLHELLACVRGHTEEVSASWVRDVGRDAPALFRRVREARRRLIREHFGRLLEEGRRSALIRSDLPLEFQIELLLGATDAIVNPAKLTELGMIPREGLSGVITVFLEGLLTEKGRFRV